MNVEIGMRLADLPKEHGYSQEELAEKLGLSRQAVSKWERAESSPDTDNLIALADLYGVSLDTLLHMSPEARDDARYEQAERAEEAAPDAGAAPASSAATATNAAADSAGATDSGKVHFGRDGFQVDDGKDHVNISWRGIHVQSSEGDEVHVDCHGVFVNDAAHAKETTASAATAGSSECVGEAHVIDDADGVCVNGQHYGSWHEAHEAWDKKGHGLNAAQRFPMALIVVIVYLLLGIFLGAWGPGLFVVFAIPLYHVTVDSITKRRPSHIVTACYPIVVTAWFLWMAFIVGQPHPAWVVLLTIPLVEWAAVSISKWWRRRNKAE